MGFFDTQNPGIGGLDELTDSEALLVQSLNALGDPNADRILFWDDSAGGYRFLRIGTNLSITGTTLDASGGGGVAWGAIAGTLSDQTDLQTALNAKQATITFGTGVQTALGVNIGSAGAPVLFNGALGTPSSGTLTNATGLPIAGITGLGTGVGTALAVNVGSAGAFITFNGAGGTPSSITLTNGTGLPISGLTASTVTALGVGSIELGHASDTTIARVSAGVVSIEGNNIVVNTSSPTLGTITTTGNIELGHASDTTIARVSAGVISVEGVTIPTISSTSTFTNKTITSSTNVLGGVTMTLGSDADGDIYYRSSGVLTRLAKGTSLQQLRMNSGATAPEWFTSSGGGGFPTQDFAINNSSSDIGDMTATSSTDGSVMFVAIDQNGSTVTIYRLAKDSGTSNYKITHSTTLNTVSSSALGGLACDSTYLYVTCSISGTGAVRRYSVADLSGVTTMTISGTNSFGSGKSVWLEGTNLYVQSSSGTYRQYAISGTTLTDTTTVSYTSAGNPIYGAISNGTDVWMTDGAGGASSITIRKYPIAGGAATSTETLFVRSDAYYQTSTSHNTGLQLVMGSSSILGILWGYSLSNPTTATGEALHIMGITLP